MRSSFRSVNVMGVGQQRTNSQSPAEQQTQTDEQMRIVLFHVRPLSTPQARPSYEGQA